MLCPRLQHKQQHLHVVRSASTNATSPVNTLAMWSYVAVMPTAVAPQGVGGANQSSAVISYALLMSVKFIQVATNKEYDE